MQIDCDSKKPTGFFLLCFDVAIRVKFKHVNSQLGSSIVDVALIFCPPHYQHSHDRASTLMVKCTKGEAGCRCQRVVSRRWSLPSEPWSSPSAVTTLLASSPCPPSPLPSSLWFRQGAVWASNQRSRGVAQFRQAAPLQAGYLLVIPQWSIFHPTDPNGSLFWFWWLAHGANTGCSFFVAFGYLCFPHVLYIVIHPIPARFLSRFFSSKIAKKKRTRSFHTLQVLPPAPAPRPFTSRSAQSQDVFFPHAHVVRPYFGGRGLQKFGPREFCRTPSPLGGRRSGCVHPTSGRGCPGFAVRRVYGVEEAPTPPPPRALVVNPGFPCCWPFLPNNFLSQSCIFIPNGLG